MAQIALARRLADDWPLAVRPDWVCEVVSPGTARYDRSLMAQPRAVSGIPWHWIIDGAERAAVIYTVLANCKLAGVEPWASLNAVLAELAQLRVATKPKDVVVMERASHLGPHEWLAARRVVGPAN